MALLRLRSASLPAHDVCFLALEMDSFRNCRFQYCESELFGVDSVYSDDM